MTAPHAANAVARSRPWNVLLSRPSVAGSISDAPMPSMIASPTTSETTPVERAATREPTAKSAAPIMKIVRGPWMSARRPPMISSAANVRLYPVMTHCSFGSVVWKSRRIVGIATLSTVVSRAAMSTADRMITSVIQRRGSGARSSVGVGSCIVVVSPSEACIVQVSSEQVKSAVGAGMVTATTDPVALGRLETELAMLTRTLEGMSRRSTLYGELDRSSYVLARTLATEAPVSINGLAELVGLDATTVTRQVATMETEGLVRRKRHPQDRRVSLVELTALGRRRMDAVRAARESRITELVGDWSDADQAAFGQLLGRFNEAIRAHPR